MVAAEFRRPHAWTAPHRTVFRVGLSSPWSSVLLNRIIFFTTADCSRSIILLIKSTPRADRYDHDDDDDDQDGDGDDRDETVNALKLYAAQSTEPPDGRDRSRGHHTRGGGGHARATTATTTIFYNYDRSTATTAGGDAHIIFSDDTITLSERNANSDARELYSTIRRGPADGHDDDDHHMTIEQQLLILRTVPIILIYECVCDCV